MEDCIFCKIVKGEIPSKKVYEDEEVFSFWDINPKAPVHILTVSKKHIPSLDDASEIDSEILGKMLLTCKNIAKENGVGGNYKVVTNIGEPAGQTVFHIHFHLVGGWKDKNDVKSEL
jgi:histidine triad (HIT) family protein